MKHTRILSGHTNITLLISEANLNYNLHKYIYFGPCRHTGVLSRSKSTIGNTFEHTKAYYKNRSKALWSD